MSHRVTNQVRINGRLSPRMSTRSSDRSEVARSKKKPPQSSSSKRRRSNELKVSPSSPHTLKSKVKKGNPRIERNRLQPQSTLVRTENSEPHTRSTQELSSQDEFLVVGVGASAGGLEALKQFLSSLPNDTGAAFVLIQHLDPKHESLSSDILSRATKMSVTEVKNGMRVESNHVYVLPPGSSMEISDRVLRLLPRNEGHNQTGVIDLFFRSLAEDRRSFSIGVILSGNGSDGTDGLMAIQGEGGVTFAQTPHSAKFDDMPKSAIASGYADLTLPPQDIAKYIEKIAHHRFTIPKFQSQSGDKKGPIAQGNLDQIFLLLKEHCQVDFTHYKSNTIQRRLERRMILHKMDDFGAYTRLLSKDPEEVKALYTDILIHVTGFFRDPDAFEAIRREVLPELMKERPPGMPIRVWVPGCSTGEEVYSIAILLLEFLGDRISNSTIQIFASDISEQAIQKARIGEYPESIRMTVSPERLNRFFTKTDNGRYKISKSIRDLCLFSRHDLTTDPPFSKIDLISCRNLLIYFTATLQKHVIPIFHYALCPKGFLWLGRSETIGGFSSLFSSLDKTNKIYARRNAPLALNLQFPASIYVPPKQQLVRRSSAFVRPEPDAQKLTDLALQAEYPGVLINDEMEILSFRGRTAPFIEPAGGVASYQLLKMARADFLPDLRMLIQSAKKKNLPMRKEGVHFKDGPRAMTFDLKVIPVKPSAESKERYYYVLFENASESTEPKRKRTSLIRKKSVRGRRSKSHLDPYIVDLQEELITSQDYQRSLVDKYEAAQEDLTTTNEELQSANEELQSSNEELETAKEELQSSNEELSTVNDELQSRSGEQVQLSNDLINLLGSVEIPILMLDNEHRIRRFTPLASKALNLISTDVGRPIGDLRLTFSSPVIELDLDDLVSEVLETMNSRELEVQDRNGRWFRLQVRPYKTVDHRIDGIVLALVDIDALKQSLKEIKSARAEADQANRGKDLFLAMLSHELRTPLTSILSWAQMLRMGKLDPEKTKKGIAIIEESGKAQAQLINDLLDVSRIIAGKLSLNIQEINPSSAIHAAIESIRPIAETKSIRIETLLDPEVGTVMADSVRMQQVLWNLLTNAIKFSPPESKVVVKLSKRHRSGDEPAQAMIQVSDSGKGIAPEFLPHIFNRFSQEDGSSVRVHGGLGLGLAIVRNLVELHRGTVQAESDGEQQGATFTVLLPIQSNLPLQEPLIRLGQGNEEIRLDGIRVLVIDDSSDTREAFSEILRSVGAEIQTASTTPEALALVEQFKPDVLVSDIAMPGEDGYSLIRKLRALPQSQGGLTPAIAVTAYAGAEDIKHILAANFQAHLPKPLDIRRLLETIENLVKPTSRSDLS